MSLPPLWVWALMATAVAAALGFYWWRRLRLARARRAIENVIASVAYDMLRHVLLPTGSGEQIHVNYLLLTQKGLLVVDLIDVHGVVFAGEKMAQWSVLGPRKHFMFANPLPVLYDRLAAVRLLALDEVPVEGRVLFTMRGEFPKGRPEAVIRLDELQDAFPQVETSPGNVAVAFAPAWERIKAAAQPNPLAG